MEEKKDQIEEIEIDGREMLRQYDGLSLKFDAKHLIAFDTKSMEDNRFIVDLIGVKDEQGRQLCFMVDTGSVVDFIFTPAIKYIETKLLESYTDLTVQTFDGTDDNEPKGLYEVEFMLNNSITYKRKAVSINKQIEPIGENRAYIGLLSFDFLVANELVIFPQWGFMTQLLQDEEEPEK